IALLVFFFFFQAEDGIRDIGVTGVQTCALPISVACYRAAGIDFASEEEYAERVGRHLRIGEVAGQKRGGSSTLQSIIRGHTTVEVDYLNGEIALLGALHGVPAPANGVVRALATRIAADGLHPG